jgi:hypothetical protein
LDIANPEIRLRPLEDHLKVDTCKTRCEASGGDREEPVDWVHFMMVTKDRLRGSSLNLDNADTDRKEEESKPLVASKTFAEKNDGEPGSGEDLHLVGDLERGDVEISGRYVLEVVLDDIKDGGDGEFPAVG